MSRDLTVGHEVKSLLESWKRWSTTADRSEEGWESDFPEWQALIDAACVTMKTAHRDPGLLTILGECWAIAHEDEELLSWAREHWPECLDTLEALAESPFAECRWQVYEAIASAGPNAETTLRKSLTDPDGYARRRALLALATIRPPDAEALAEQFLSDADPYMRQAALAMVLASRDDSYRRRAIGILRTDVADHVRRAAEAEWDRLEGPDDEVGSV